MKCLAGKEGPRGKDFNMRWVAAMVADVHRILMPRRHLHVPLGQARAEQTGQAAPDVRGQPHGLAGGTSWRRWPPMAASASWKCSPPSCTSVCSVVLGSKNEVERVTQYHLEADKNSL